MTRRLLLALLAVLVSASAMAVDSTKDTFDGRPETRWRFFTDGVMGGVSTGQVGFPEEDGRRYARMTGEVSTENRGGFIQMRRELPAGAPANATGVRLVVRGNGQRYFVHLRTGGTLLPWQYYQGEFDVTSDWTEVRLPFSAFQRSGRMLRAIPRAGDITSIGIVAYGRDHEAAIDVREVGFY